MRSLVCGWKKVDENDPDDGYQRTERFMSEDFSNFDLLSPPASNRSHRASWPESRKSSRAALIYHEVVHELGQLRRPKTSAKVGLLFLFMLQLGLSVMIAIYGMKLLDEQEAILIRKLDHRQVRENETTPYPLEESHDSPFSRRPESEDDLLEKVSEINMAYLIARVFFISLWTLIQGIELCGAVGIVTETHTLIYIHVIMSIVGLIFTVFIPFRQDIRSNAALIQIIWILVSLTKILFCVAFIRSMQVRRRHGKRRAKRAMSSSTQGANSRRLTMMSVMTHPHHQQLAQILDPLSPTSNESSPSHSYTNTATSYAYYNHRPSYFYTINEMV